MTFLKFALLGSATALLVAPSARAVTCNPEKEYVTLPDGTSFIRYMRVHPDGNYVMYSGGGIKIVDFSEKNSDGVRNAKRIETPMIDETYPVEGSWTLMASPNHNNGMNYFKFDEVLQQNRAAKAKFNDSGHNQYYHSSAELQAPGPDGMKFRTLLWQGRRYKDYDVKIDSEGKADVKMGEQKTLCNNIESEARASLGDTPEKVAARAAASARMRAIEAIYSSRPPSEQNTLRDEFMRLQSQTQAAGLWSMSFNNPILSKDGAMVAAQYNPPGKTGSQHIFKVRPDGSCEILKDLGFNTGKVNFAYPEAGKKGRLVFQGSVPNGGTGVYVYDLDTDKATKINDADSASYPGFTKDGRVIYATTQNVSAPVPTASGPPLTTTRQLPSLAIIDVKQKVDGIRPTNCTEPSGTRPANGGTQVQ